ncbi:hypothetical protein [Mycolicibacterium sp.]|uniref:hypothetical protein n=1 Tax=Mycolicibacterium sp. TaxID=2320850 RepID=UPI0037C801D8
MPSKHRYPAITPRPAPELRERAKIAVAEVNSSLNGHIIEFLRWLVGDTDTLPPRPTDPVPPVVPRPKSKKHIRRVIVNLYPNWIDADIRAQNPDLTLRAARLGKPWRGLPSPVVTEAEWRRFIGAHAAHDPDGTYRPDGIHVTAAALIYIDTEDHANGLTVDDYEGFPRVGVDEAGDAVYEVSGWDLAVEDNLDD